MFRRRVEPPAPSRLARAEPDLAARIAAAPATAQRAIAAGVASLAVRETGLADPVVERALRSIRGGAPVAADVRAAVTSLLFGLEQRQWHLQDLVEEGREAPANQAAAFAQARACNAVEYALAEDPLTAVLEATYETLVAVGDMTAVRSVLAENGC